MCLLAVYFRVLPGAPILLAANREEWRSRPTSPPQRLAGSPQVICGLDLVAGGTWLGVNQQGVVVAVTNRPFPKPSGTPPSRGILCRRLLSLPTAADAAWECARQFATGSYAGANFVCLDSTSGYVVSNPGEVVTVTLSPGLHVLTNGNLNDEADARIARVRRLLASESFSSVAEFLDKAQCICRLGPDPQTGTSIVLHSQNYGTVSSTILGLTDETRQAVYRYAPGSPDEQPYDDYSSLLREVLASAAD